MAKISVTQIIIGISLLLALLSGLLVGRRVLESLQLSLSLDESLAASTTPQLNKVLLKRAIFLVNHQTSLDLSQNSQKSFNSENPKTATIINNTTISGLASEVAKQFPEGVKVNLENGLQSSTLQHKSKVYYKGKYRSFIIKLSDDLAKLGWPVVEKQATESATVDVSVILGTQ